jgi:sulfatase maturation enzyme AslB (radical SAM superfamily)
MLKSFEQNSAIEPHVFTSSGYEDAGRYANNDGAKVEDIRILTNSLYIEPISACNLCCKMCYTNVINGAGRRVITTEHVLHFAKRFLAVTPPPAEIFWCGTGEVFLHPGFPTMVNALLSEDKAGMLSQIIQTNGTVHRLKEFSSLERLDFQVSIDGLRQFHEWQRGKNTYDRTLDFCREAVDLGCRSMVVRMLLTKDNIHTIDEFYAEIRQRIGPQVQLRFIVPFNNQALSGTRKHALAINPDEIEDTAAISEADVFRIFEQQYQNRYLYNVQPALSMVENYLSLTTYGVFSCCNGIVKIGDPDADILTLFERLAVAQDSCRACSLFPCQ